MYERHAHLLVDLHMPPPPEQGILHLQGIPLVLNMESYLVGCHHLVTRLFLTRVTLLFSDPTFERVVSSVGVCGGGCVCVGRGGVRGGGGVCVCGGMWGVCVFYFIIIIF